MAHFMVAMKRSLKGHSLGARVHAAADSHEKVISRRKRRVNHINGGLGVRAVKMLGERGKADMET